MQPFPVTVHMIVRNEECFIWHALNSVLPFVSNALVYDTGSTDTTKAIVQKLMDSQFGNKIMFRISNITKPETISKLRKQQLNETKTPWILLVDGDEIWPQKQLIKLLQLTKSLSKETLAVVNRTRNCAGDIWHYVPDLFGKYTFLGKTGNLNIRLMRNLDYDIKGQYPSEAYYFNGKSINETDNALAYAECWYLHATHLQRTRVADGTFGRRRPVYASGISMKKQELPESFFATKPELIPDVTHRRNLQYEFVAQSLDMIRKVKSRFL